MIAVSQILIIPSPQRQPLNTTSANNTPRQLTFSSAADIDPALSPEGTKIAYSSNGSGIFQLMTVRIDGSHEIQLTHFNADARLPKWTGDGKRIVFLVCAGQGERTLHIISTDGNGLSSIAPEVSVSSFAISPDSKNILFDGMTSNSNESHIYEANLINYSYHELFEGAFPSWSPDGKSVVYSHEMNGNYVVMTRELDNSGSAHNLTSPLYSSIKPFFTGDGNSVYFMTDSQGYWSEWVSNLNGTEATEVGNFNFDLDINYTTTISSDYSRLSIAAVAPDGSATLMLFLIDPPPPNPNAPFRGLYDAPVGYNFGSAGCSLSVPSLNQDATTVVYSILANGGQHLWILSSIHPISPYGT